MTEKSSEIIALIRLLDDEDPEVFNNVFSRLMSYGPDVIPELEHAWEDTLNPVIHERIEELIHQINFEQLFDAFQRWNNEKNPSLLDGAVLVARYLYPDIKKKDLEITLHTIRQKIWLELGVHLTPLESINVFNQVFYGIIGFGGSYTKKQELKDYCINHVLESKNGNVISLGIIYLILAQDLDIPVYGVNLYRHFVLAYTKYYMDDTNTLTAQDVIFYINPMNRGNVFSRNEIKEYLKSMNHEEQKKYFVPVHTKQVIQELLQYMIAECNEKKEQQKAEELIQLLEVIDLPNENQKRD